jgi:hypothetical protein
LEPSVTGLATDLVLVRSERLASLMETLASAPEEGEVWPFRLRALIT